MGNCGKAKSDCARVIVVAVLSGLPAGAIFLMGASQAWAADLSASLPQGTKLSEFVYKGTFTGTIGGEKHKYTYFEATATPP